MPTLYEQVQAISPEDGYRIQGTVWLAYGGNFDEVERYIDEYIYGRDAFLLSKEKSEQEIAKMIANIYSEFDIDEEDPNFSICNLDRWDLVIESAIRET